MRTDILRITALLIPKIESILEYNIKDYEKLVLIKHHIKGWRNTK